MNVGLDFCVLKRGKETWTWLDFKKPIWIFALLASFRLSAQNFPNRGGIFLNTTNLSEVPPTDSGTISSHQQAHFQVWISLSEVCMISRYYAIELNQLHTNLRNQGIFLGGFFPGAFSSDSSIQEFREKNKLTFPLFRDSLALFAKSANIRKTPEVVVVDSAGQVQYKGRIDDFYVAIGRHKTRVSQTYLLDALRNLMNGKPPEKKMVEAIGCLIDFTLWPK